MAPTPTTATDDRSGTGEILESGVTFAPMDVRADAELHDRLLAERLDELVPDLMADHGLEAWVVDSREYNEDPVAKTMLPATWLQTARRRSILVFTNGGRDRAAISRYPIGPFPSAWDPESQPDQWKALADHLADVTGPVGINQSHTFPLADGLTSSEHIELVDALDGHRLQSAENVAIGWLETRLESEVGLMEEACGIAHGFLRRALSNEVIEPGQTSTEDVAWWLVQQVHDAGMPIWFHPGVSVQRNGDDQTTPADALADRRIERGDLVHIDFGIVRRGYHTDQQQHAYVLREGETAAPRSMVEGLASGNKAQDILMCNMSVGLSGNEVLRNTLDEARDQHVPAIIYTHPIGLHGHAAGSTIGMWDNQTSIPGAGDYPVRLDTAWSIELAVDFEVEEWDGQPAKIMLEEDAFLGADGVRFLDGRQEELWLVS